MSKIYKRYCNACNKYYKGHGSKFCSQRCSQKKQIRWNKNKKGVQTAWNIGLTHDTDDRIKCTPHSMKSRMKQSKTAKKRGIGLWNIDRKQTKEWKEKRLSKTRGEKHYNWKDGLTNSQRKEKIADRKKTDYCECCGEKGRICFDHNHITGKFRGWVCARCNLTLGQVKDSINILNALIKYLEFYDK